MKFLSIAILFMAACGSVPHVDKTIYLPSQVVTLCYHETETDPDNEWSRTMEDFRNDLDFFESQGYKFSTLNEVAAGKVDGKTVVLNFDDATAGNYEAAKELFKRNIIGEFFIPTANVGKTAHLTWEQIADMASMGMIISSHSYNHIHLADQSESELEKQLTQSKSDLEAHGYFSTTMALPFGSGATDQNVVDSALKAGYEIIRGTEGDIKYMLPNAGIKNLSFIFMNKNTNVQDVADMLNQAIEK